MYKRMPQIQNTNTKYEIQHTDVHTHTTRVIDLLSPLEKVYLCELPVQLFGCHRKSGGKKQDEEEKRVVRAEEAAVKAQKPR